MKIKEKLNEFEADWAAVPTIKKETLLNLKGKTILICGHKLARCLCYSLLYLNETQKLNCKVILCGKSAELPKDYYADVLLRNDFEYLNFNLISEANNIDYIIYTGFCNEKSTDRVTTFKNEIYALNAVAQIAKKSKVKVVLLSDSRIYGNAKPHRIYSENEYADVKIASTNNFDCQLLRTIENLWHCNQKQYGFELTVIRTGIILGACSGINTLIDEVIECVSKGLECQIFNSLREYSFIYISDVLNVAFWALAETESNQTYNLTKDNLKASTGMIAAILHDIYGEKAKIKLTETDDADYCAINANKIDEHGYTPAISLETALELCVMSKADNNKALALPHNHDGRLESIHSILLAYLLEVDRICRKHNIKYFLAGGTLLGAIRHHGFIPWDDDADIMMLREDYDKFCKIAESELPKNMTFQSNETDKSCYYEFAKIRLDNTVFATGFSKNHKSMHNGLDFDIFCHDKTANSKFGQKVHLGMTLFTRALVFNKWNNRKADNGNKLQTAFTNFCIKLFPIRFSLWLEKKALSFFKGKKNAKYLYDGMGRNIYNGSFPINYLKEVIYVDFEGYKLPVPKEYDKYLTFLYGDYRELAPLSTRLGCHEIKLCDIGEYDGTHI